MIELTQQSKSNLLFFILITCVRINTLTSFSRNTFLNNRHGRKTFIIHTSITTTEEHEIDRDIFLLLSRSKEVGSTVGKLMIPLITSATTFVLSNKDDGELLWERFWLSESNMGNNAHLSNAERIVFALEELGPTYVKFGQAIASRPDIIPKSLAAALSNLQDGMKAFDTDIAKTIIKQELESNNINDKQIETLLDSLSPEPVAAASVGQVYKGYLPDIGHVAVKVQRPDLKPMVQKDYILLRKIASFIESIPNPTDGSRLINTELVEAVDEFMSRVFEELDYTNEASNAKKFARLYSNKYGTAKDTLPGNGVIVPEIIDQFCSENVLVMEWVNGTKLTSFQTMEEQANNSQDISDEQKENLQLIEQALYVTLSQLLEHGLMHADPHNGNLLKVRQYNKRNTATLAYLDFGLVATIPSTVRDALVCAVAQLIFSKDVEAVASLFAELDLIDEDIIQNPIEKKALTDALSKTMEEVLVYSTTNTIASTTKVCTDVPILKFDKLLDGLVRLIPRFKFQLPPYFINNARALGTLEGTARTINPNFNAFSIMYPFALNRILINPTKSIVVDKTLQKMVRFDDGRIDVKKVKRMLNDSVMFTGFSRFKVLKDVLRTKNGRRLGREMVVQMIRKRRWS